MLADQAALALENSRLYAEVRSTRDSLQAITENSPDAIVTTDVHGQVTYFSPAAEEIFGYAAGEIVGRPVAPYYRYGREEARAVMRRLRTEGRIRNYETTVQAKGGRRVEASASFSLLRDASGTIVGTLAVMKDLTERKRAEEALADSKHLLRTIIETEPECVKLVAASGTLLDMNRAGLAMIEAESVEQVVGKPVEPLVAPEYRPAFRALAEAVFRGEPGQLEFEIVGLKGTRRWMETHAVPLRNQKGDIIALLAVTRDISARKQAEAALCESEAQLRQAQKMEAIGRLAGGVAHDFNNLLTVITGRAELLLQHIKRGDPPRRHLELIATTADRAAALTQQLLAFSRKQILQPTVLDVTAVLAGVEKMLRRLIGEDIELVTVTAPNLGCVKADPGQLEQVLMNLVVNARDAMPQGGRLTIETADVELDEAARRGRPDIRPGPYVRLAVSDTGVGMDAETRSHLFEPFFTTKSPDKGTGLGLATVYGIVTQSGGFIEVESAPGQGARFEIYLPRVDEAGERAETPQQGTEVPRGSETILLVEDEPELRDLAREVLELQGYPVLEAQHPGDALRIAEQHPGPIHLLVTDVVMPQMSGRELAERLTESRPDLKVLYLTGYTDDAVVRHGVLAGRVPLLQKPFQPDALARTVREVLDHAPAGAVPSPREPAHGKQRPERYRSPTGRDAALAEAAG